ncbi:hypothetical protein Hanom_Chr07g00640371 [Helianthus anomalus]
MVLIYAFRRLTPNQILTIASPKSARPLNPLQTRTHVHIIINIKPCDRQKTTQTKTLGSALKKSRQVTIKTVKKRMILYKHHPSSVN